MAAALKLSAFFRERVPVPQKSGKIADASPKKRTGIMETMSGVLKLINLGGHK
jgi:hypothetical protein